LRCVRSVKAASVFSFAAVFPNEDPIVVVGFGERYGVCRVAAATLQFAGLFWLFF
jgi:hypothetical protein